LEGSSGKKIQFNNDLLHELTLRLEVAQESGEGYSLEVNETYDWAGSRRELLPPHDTDTVLILIPPQGTHDTNFSDKTELPMDQIYR
jgi:hypothetical protein